MTADLRDLVLEKWMRQRDSGALKWKTKDGNEISIKDMSDKHLDNAIKSVAKYNEYEDVMGGFDPMDWWN